MTVSILSKYPCAVRCGRQAATTRGLKDERLCHECADRYDRARNARDLAALARDYADAVEKANEHEAELIWADLDWYADELEKARIAPDAAA